MQKPGINYHLPSNLTQKGKHSAVQIYIHASKNDMFYVGQHLFLEVLFAYFVFLTLTL